MAHPVKPGFSPLWVATKRGFFEQQGLDVQLVLLRGMPITGQALAAGSLHFGSGGPEPYIDAAERGLNFIITGGVINGTAQFIIAGKNYKSYEDLRGATFGTASLTGGTITALREALKSGGLSIRVIISCRSLPAALRQTMRHLSRSNYSNVSSSSKLTSLRELQTRVALEKS